MASTSMVSRNSVLTSNAMQQVQWSGDRIDARPPQLSLPRSDFTNGESGCRSVAGGFFGYGDVQPLAKALIVSDADPAAMSRVRPRLRAVTALKMLEIYRGLAAVAAARTGRNRQRTSSAARAAPCTSPASAIAAIRWSSLWPARIAFAVM